jgi:hypothetical protein
MLFSTVTACNLMAVRPHPQGPRMPEPAPGEEVPLALKKLVFCALRCTGRMEQADNRP